MSVLPLTFVRPPKYDEPEELLYWIVPPFMVVMPVKPPLSPETVSIPVPDFINVPPPVRKEPYDWLFERLNSNVFPPTFVIPPKYDVPLYNIFPPRIFVVPLKPLLFPETVNVPAPALLNVPEPLIFPEIASSTAKSYVNVALFVTLPPKKRSEDVFLSKYNVPASITVIPLNPEWFPVNVSVDAPVLLNVPLPVIAFEKLKSLPILNSSTAPDAIFVEPPK